jgi:hypothetical protein
MSFALHSCPMHGGCWDGYTLNANIARYYNLLPDTRGVILGLRLSRRWS